MTPIKFGTSGWRGILADDFTFARARIVTAAIARYVKESGLADRGVVVGYDTRFLSEAFARDAAAGLAAAGLPVSLCTRDAPTPALASEILHRGAAGGINVTASHNPPEYNGIKFSMASGGPALPEVTAAIEAEANRLLAGPPLPPPSLSGLPAGRIIPTDPYPAYAARVLALLDLACLRRARLRVVVDPLYGTGRGYLDVLCREVGCEVSVIHDHRDPLFGGGTPEPSAENLRDLAGAMRERGAHLGLATDGDADRFGILDSDGTFVEPNYLLGLLLDYLAGTRGWQGGVARSVATTHLVDAAAQRRGVPVYETPVGFKYIGDLLTQGKILLGGEESAGLTVKGHVPEKDGILACLLAAEMVAANGGRPIAALLQDLYRAVGTILSRRINLPLSPAGAARLRAVLASPPTTLGGERVRSVNRLDGTKLLLEDGSWVLLRPSGTEPMVRLYVEAHSPERLDALEAAGRGLLDGE
ncbi:MAG: phosphoglucomutase/phosphomannomutase family protein [candidate division NC10 bacterium]|nr:phosphoglucomutase/phosphomannomutase family protein [candidate division NC10 bacterium]